MISLIRLFDTLIWSVNSLGKEDSLTNLYRSRIESSVFMMMLLGATDMAGYERVVAMADACIGVE